jgi:hypothetical protein
MAAAWRSWGRETKGNGKDARGGRRGADIVLKTCPKDFEFKMDGTGESSAYKYGGGFRV